MTRKRIILAAVAAAVAIGAGALIIAAAGAHTPATFTFSEGLPPQVKSLSDGSGGNATQVLEIPGLGEVTCTKVEYQGVPEANPTTSIALKPTFSGCEFLGQPYMLMRGECQFVFNANGQLAISSEPKGDCAKFPIVLAHENPEKCAVWFSEQVLSGATYTNEGSPKSEVTAALSLKGLKGERSEDCEAEGPFTEGEYKKGNTVLLGYEGTTKRSMKWLATVP